jgi:hypothetical protein
MGGQAGGLLENPEEMIAAQTHPPGRLLQADLAGEVGGQDFLNAPDDPPAVTGEFRKAPTAFPQVTADRPHDGEIQVDHALGRAHPPGRHTGVHLGGIDQGDLSGRREGVGLAGAQAVGAAGLHEADGLEAFVDVVGKGMAALPHRADFNARQVGVPPIGDIFDGFHGRRSTTRCDYPSRP